MEAMERWNLLPSQWDNATEDDRAEILAYIDTKSAMLHYEEYRQKVQRVTQEAQAKLKMDNR